MPFPFRMATVGRHAGSQACEIMTAIVQKHTHIYLQSFAIMGKKTEWYIKSFTSASYQ